MIADFGYIGILLIVGILFTITTLLLPITFRLFKIVPRKSNPAKESTYECGMETIGKTWVQFNFRYYFYALVFLALDVLVVFLLPWAVGLKKLGYNGLIGILILVFIVVVGYIYALKKKALEWQ